MDQKELDEKVKAFLSTIPSDEDIEKMMSDLSNIDEDFEDTAENLALQEQGGGFKSGYDAGFVDGYEEGKLIQDYEAESNGYNSAIADILSSIEQIDFDGKDEIVEIINQYRRPL